MRSTSAETSTKTQAPTSTVEPALADAWKRFNAAFNRLDAREVASFWEENGTLIGPTGTRGAGRAGIEKVYAGNVETMLRGTTSTFTVETVRMLGQDLALLDVAHEIRGATMPGGTTGTMKLHVVVLARKHGKDWLWVDTRPYAFLPQPPAAPLH
jgi:uncharacterized protein (TIGR02246 family)